MAIRICTISVHARVDDHRAPEWAERTIKQAVERLLLDQLALRASGVEVNVHLWEKVDSEGKVNGGSGR